MANQTDNPNRQFLRVADEPAPPDQTNDVAISMMTMALKALSQRALVALASLFTLLTMASAFALWWRVLPDPTTPQLIGLGLYGALVLAINFMVMRKR